MVQTDVTTQSVAETVSATMLISAALIARDEERDLPACLESLKWCDDVVVVVDSRSTDATAEVAKAAGARVIFRAWEGWTPQRNFAFGQCRGEWIFAVDADERITPELRDEILATIRDPRAANGYFVGRRNHWLGRWIRHGGWYPDYAIRLFRRGTGVCRYMVHERIEIDGPTSRLQNDLMHDNIQAINEHMTTALRATDGEAREMLANGVCFYMLLPWRPIVAYVRELCGGPCTYLRAYLLAKKHFKNRAIVLWYIPIAPAVKFLRMFVLQQGYKDGIHGFWVAVLSAMYVVLKYAKYWELTHSPKPA